MGIKNGTIMVGHIAGDPRLTHSEKTGTPRFYARVGVDHWRREDDGTFTKTDRTFLRPRGALQGRRSSDGAVQGAATTSSPPDGSRSSPTPAPGPNARSSAPTPSPRTRSAHG
ncbi:hypothetical protein QP028_03120 [Corynebacterium suedekumii]|nr:hypothetical protein QP028_03120 [Corynebacterium suedekumii]